MDVQVRAIHPIQVPSCGYPAHADAHIERTSWFRGWGCLYFVYVSLAIHKPFHTQSINRANTCVFCCLVLFVVYVIVLLFSPVNEKLVRLFAGVTILVSSLIIALLFPFTGRRLLHELSKSMFVTPERINLLRKVGVLTVVCSITFLLRAIYSMLELSVEYVDGGHPWTEFAYFIVVEIIPSSLMFSVLRPALGKRKFWVSRAGPAPGMASAPSTDGERFDDMSTPLNAGEYLAATKD
jgi:hypothetical protein